MTADQLVVLAIIQGLTEFLPVSSSGHLNLLHLLTNYPDEGPAIDVAIHVGSLVAVMAYFWRDMLFLLSGLRDVVFFRRSDAARLILLLALASVPLAIVGFIMLKSGLVGRGSFAGGDRLDNDHIRAGAMGLRCDRQPDTGILADRYPGRGMGRTCPMRGADPRGQPVRHNHVGGASARIRAHRGGTVFDAAGDPGDPGDRCGRRNGP